MMRIFLLFSLFSCSLMFSQETGRFAIENSNINTKNNEFGVYQSPDGFVWFSKSKSKPNKDLDKIPSKLFKADLLADGSIDNATKFVDDIKNLAFTRDGRYVFFSKKIADKHQLFMGVMTDDGYWTQELKLPFSELEFNFKQPVLSKDETTLFFTSDRQDSYGKTDIYYVKIKNIADFLYGNPINLGESVNSPANESHPFVDSTGRLFFSSEDASMGGLDIFESYNYDGFYAAKMNLGASINSVADDFAYVAVNSNTGYFSSNRGEGKGGVDIYSFKETPVPAIKGVVLNQETQEPIVGAVVYFFSPNGSSNTVYTDEAGLFVIDEVKHGVNYDIVAQKDGYKGFSEVLAQATKGAADLRLLLTPDPDALAVEQGAHRIIVGTQTQRVLGIDDVINDKEVLPFSENKTFAKSADTKALIKALEEEKSRPKVNYTQAEFNSIKASQDIHLYNAKNTIKKLREGIALNEEKLLKDRTEVQGASAEIERLARVLTDKQLEKQQATSYSEKEKIAKEIRWIKKKKKTLETKQARLSLFEELGKNVVVERKARITEIQSLVAELAQKQDILRANIYNNGEVVVVPDTAVDVDNEVVEDVVVVPDTAVDVDNEVVEDVVVVPDTAVEVDNEVVEDVVVVPDTAVEVDNEVVEDVVVVPDTAVDVDNEVVETENSNTPGRCAKDIFGSVQSSRDYKPISEVTIDVYYEGQNIETSKTDAKGKFAFYNLDCNTKYTFICYKEDIDDLAKATINTENQIEDLDDIVLLLTPDAVPVVEDNEQDFELDDFFLPKVVNGKLVLDPIYFDLDEHYLTLSARRELDKIIVLMIRRPTMIIESGSHTDTQGDFDYNLALSERRSQEAVGYLIANGVDPDRITGRGYGESIPLNHCLEGVKCTDAEHNVNRRTEFRILKE